MGVDRRVGALTMFTDILGMFSFFAGLWMAGREESIDLWLPLMMIGLYLKTLANRDRIDAIQK